jgi:hypothetical protein
MEAALLDRRTRLLDEISPSLVGDISVGDISIDQLRVGVLPQ